MKARARAISGLAGRPRAIKLPAALARTKHQQRIAFLLLLLAALLLLMGSLKASGGRLYLGSLGMPRPEMARYLLIWGFFGTGTVLLGTLGLSSFLRPEFVDAVRRRVRTCPKLPLVLGASISALLIPALIRMFVLKGAPVTDDESAYQFSAELLASGRLYVESPPQKLFFDRAFLINDGRMYTQYFLGWPALMVPFVWAGAAGYANAFYCALTVPGLFALGQRLCGRRWAPLVLLLYLSSPQLMIAAATQMSHTTCLGALVYAGWFLLRSLDHPQRWENHAAFSGFFVIAFFIRPLSALGIGLLLLGAWLCHLVRGSSWSRRAAIAFVLPAVAGATLFLAVNDVLNGSPLKTAYIEAFDYAQANGFRFSNWSPETEHVASLAFTRPDASLSTMGNAIIRSWFSVFGWPIGLAPALFAHGRRSTLWLWGSVASYFVVHYANVFAGVDPFGPVHYFEIALPLLILTTQGVAGATTLAARVSQVRHASYIPVVAVALSMALSLSLFVPARLMTVGSIAEAINMPLHAAQRLEAKKVAVFAPRPYNPYCHSEPARGFVFWPPLNDPDLERNIVWVEHLSLARDKALMKEVFSDRKGYLMFWTRACKVKLMQLDGLDPGQVPEGQPGPSELKQYLLD